MANYKVVDADRLDADLSAVADAIRSQTGSVDEIPFPDGFASAPAELVEVGKKKEYNEFWDAYQDNGNRQRYNSAFAGVGWNNITFRPKYDIRPTDGSSMFIGSDITGDFVEILRDLEVILDFSNCTTLSMVFQSIKCTRVGIIDASNCTNLGQAFAWNSVITIDKLIVSEKTVFSSNTFSGGRAQNLVMEGVLASSINFTQNSNLTLESAKSVIGCLKNFTGTGSEATQTVSFHANTWALLDAEGEASPNGNTWRDYIVSDLCWNI